MPAAPTPLIARPQIRVITFCAPPQIADPTSKMTTATIKLHLRVAYQRVSEQSEKARMARAKNALGRVDTQNLTPPENAGRLRQDEGARNPSLLVEGVEVACDARKSCDEASQRRGKAEGRVSGESRYERTGCKDRLAANKQE